MMRCLINNVWGFSICGKPAFRLSETYLRTLQFSPTVRNFNVLSNKYFYGRPDIFSFSKRKYASEYCEEEQSLLKVLEDNDLQNLVPRSVLAGSMSHQVHIIHPHIKWGPKKKIDTSPEILLEEAVSLIKTLKDWKVVSTKKISLLSFDKHTLFNKGQLETLKDFVKVNQTVSAVFVNISSLRLDQQLFLEELFGIPVFDRYSIVINIFKRHAISNEAKLQVASAEVPYVRSRLRGIDHLESNLSSNYAGISAGETFHSKRLKALSFHEQHIKRSIVKLRKNRELLRKNRKNLGIPIIAVVGYTNAGKTSLIKCLTSEENMKPENKLFATLDVTVHAGVLPCSMKVLYVDTIGFISDLPTNLLEPFIATLEDALQADLVIHVQDISNSAHIMQKKQVLKTLENLNLSDDVMGNIISVGNKHDKVTKLEDFGREFCLVSCVKQTGFDELEQKIEEGIINTLQLQKIRIRVKNGGRAYFWLQKEVTVSDCFVDDSNQDYIFLDVVISKVNLEKFKSYFIRK